ncbi:MAG: hypothetical protein Q4F72_02505, partial [Desulfovibrionaceae bacterium]|nr:hypothetical protein [Desulfovibrionaceae bacterium]
TVKKKRKNPQSMRHFKWPGCFHRGDDTHRRWNEQEKSGFVVREQRKPWRFCVFFQEKDSMMP